MGSLLEIPNTTEPQLAEAASTKGHAGIERRLRKRYPCNGFAEGIVLHPKSLFRGEIRDLSETGCFVETRARLLVECLARIDLRFTINGSHYRTPARVMNVQPGKGLGVEFLFVDKKTQELIRGLVSRLQTNKAVGERTIKT